MLVVLDTGKISCQSVESQGWNFREKKERKKKCMYSKDSLYVKVTFSMLKIATTLRSGRALRMDKFSWTMAFYFQMWADDVPNQ